MLFIASISEHKQTPLFWGLCSALAQDSSTGRGFEMSLLNLRMDGNSYTVRPKDYNLYKYIIFLR